MLGGDSKIEYAGDGEVAGLSERSEARSPRHKFVDKVGEVVPELSVDRGAILAHRC